MELDIQRDCAITLIEQFYSEIKRKIMSGVIESGYKLPSTRTLSLEYGVSRNVVIEAYDQLLAEGFIVSKPGDGSYVQKGLQIEIEEIDIPASIRQVGFNSFSTELIDFRTGLPDLSLFPSKQWAKIIKEVIIDADATMFAYGQPEGTEELRKAIANYVRVYRGVRAHYNQIIITTGTTQAIGLVSRMLLSEKNRDTILEDPITIDIQKIVSQAGGNIFPISVDKHGIKTENFPNNVEPAFIYVTPSHHYPLGVTMSIQRRVELVKYAKEKSAYIIEDDYDSEFRYDVMPTPSLQGISPENVIYLGTFSKTLCPAIRTGYIILPQELIEKARYQKWFTDLHNNIPDQLALARFINEGYFAKSITKMKKSHKRKRELLVKELNNNFGKQINIFGDSIGLHIAIRFKDIDFDNNLISNIENEGVKVYPVETHTIKKGQYKDTILLGFGFLDSQKIISGVNIIKKVLIDNGYFKKLI